VRSQDIFPAEPARGWIPWGALAPFLALAFVIATALTGDWLIAKHVRMSPEGNPLDPTALVAFTLVPFGLLLLVLLTWVKFVERRPLESIGIGGERRTHEFLRGHAIGLAGLLGVVTVIWITGGLKFTSVAPAFSQPASLVPIVPELALELKRLMAAQGFYKGNLDDSWDPASQRRLDLFLGSENYDNRIDNGGMFDLEVLADLRLRYGNKVGGVAPGGPTGALTLGG